MSISYRRRKKDIARFRKGLYSENKYINVRGRWRVAPKLPDGFKVMSKKEQQKYIQEIRLGLGR